MSKMRGCKVVRTERAASAEPNLFGLCRVANEEGRRSPERAASAEPNLFGLCRVANEEDRRSPERAASAGPNKFGLCRVANEEDHKPKKRVMLSGTLSNMQSSLARCRAKGWGISRKRHKNYQKKYLFLVVFLTSPCV